MDCGYFRTRSVTGGHIKCWNINAIKSCTHPGFDPYKFELPTLHFDETFFVAEIYFKGCLCH